MFSKLIGITRFVLFLLTVFLFLIYLFFTNFLFSKEKQVKRGLTTRKFVINNILNKILGVKITVKGSIPTDTCILMANHRTYYDAVAILKDILAFPIGKIEVQSWPLIGYIASLTGVLFVDRSNKESRSGTIHAMNQKLKEGYSIFNTPEGTTHDEPTTIYFHTGTFAVAARLNVPVVPIAIEYKLKEDAWIGDDTFIRHFIQCFGKWKTEIQITYFEPLISDDADYLLKTTKEKIDNELLRIREEWNIK
ncbi:MAG: lysophospholipid acyltransferase family protein [Flavobacteriaceae bacterium]|nr:lysophospholipid acyltransferase family protein [Flavobacteriaceae bacterium]